ncbi:hypothetical protein M2347_000764 [Chryseobacterium sp. H1D6B]|nr:hypothetical protein [Chryseobacterium sp. H1D6B]
MNYANVVLALVIYLLVIKYKIIIYYFLTENHKTNKKSPYKK